MTPDQMVMSDDWSDLARFRQLPEIDVDRMHRHRTRRLKDAMRQAGVDVCIMVNPISLRYAINYRNYAQFMAHIPSTYLFYPLEGEFRLSETVLLDSFTVLDLTGARLVQLGEKGFTLLRNTILIMIRSILFPKLLI